MAKLQPGVNDLATVNPELAAQLVDPELAKTVTAGSGKKLEWWCEGTPEKPHPRYEWTARPVDRRNRSGCRVCTGHKPMVGWNDLATTNPELAAQLVDPELAKMVTAGSSSVGIHRAPTWGITAGETGSGR